MNTNGDGALTLDEIDQPKAKRESGITGPLKGKLEIFRARKSAKQLFHRVVACPVEMIFYLPRLDAELGRQLPALTTTIKRLGHNELT